MRPHTHPPLPTLSPLSCEAQEPFLGLIHKNKGVGGSLPHLNPHPRQSKSSLPLLPTLGCNPRFDKGVPRADQSWVVPRGPPGTPPLGSAVRPTQSLNRPNYVYAPAAEVPKTAAARVKARRAVRIIFKDGWLGWSLCWWHVEWMESMSQSIQWDGRSRFGRMAHGRWLIRSTGIRLHLTLVEARLAHVQVASNRDGVRGSHVYVLGRPNALHKRAIHQVVDRSVLWDGRGGRRRTILSHRALDKRAYTSARASARTT